MIQRSILSGRVVHQALKISKNNGTWVQPAFCLSTYLSCRNQALSRRRQILSCQVHSSSLLYLKPLASPAHVEKRRSMSTESARSGNLMDFPHILFPSFVKMAKNVFFTWFIIRPYLDPNFSFKSFMDGAKQALLVVSDRLSRGDFASLRGLVTPEALAELESNYGRLSVKQRCELQLQGDHIGPVFPYEIGMIIEEEKDVQKRWVEITVCAHVHQNFAFRHQPGEQSFTPPYQMPDFTVCNYRFIRNYTKGVEDTWTVNVVNHFKPNADDQEE